MNSKAAKDNRSEGRVAERLSSIRFVLINTTHPGNIGATARAMKVMGLSKLHLVTPKTFPSADATAMASGADDLLQHATVHDSLESALDGCSLVLGTSAMITPIKYVPEQMDLQMAILILSTLLVLIFIKYDVGKPRKAISKIEGGILVALYLCFLYFSIKPPF